MLKWHYLISRNQAVDFPETGFQWNQLGELAHHFYKEYQDWQYADLLLEFERVIADILALVNQIEDDVLYQDAWYKQWSQGRMIQFNTSSPMKSTRTKVRRFIKHNNIK